jgi:hypothetical protein
MRFCDLKRFVTLEFGTPRDEYCEKKTGIRGIPQKRL